MDASEQHSPELPDAVIEALRRGQKIEAIKLLIQHHRGLGLRDAKRSVERFERASAQPDGDDWTQTDDADTSALDGLSPGEVPPTSSRLTVAILVAAVVYLLYRLMLD